MAVDAEPWSEPGSLFVLGLKLGAWGDEVELSSRRGDNECRAWVLLALAPFLFSVAAGGRRPC